MGKTLFLFLLALFVSCPMQAQKTKILRQVFKKPVLQTPSIPSRLFSGAANAPLSGRVLFTRVTPDWKLPLQAKFSPAHLHFVERAFLATDAALFSEQNGQLSARSDEWNYTERFTRELAALTEQSGQPLSPSQWKQILGGAGVKGPTLANHLRLLTLESWMLTHGGEYPRKQFSVNGRVLKPEELSPEQKQEQTLANSLKWAVSHPKDESDPVFLHLKLRQEQGSRKKTPDYWLEELKMWLLAHEGEYPRSSFSSGTRIAAEDLTPAQKAEASLANGINNAISLAKDPSDPVIAELIRLKEAGKRYHTPEQTLALLEEWSLQHGGRMPRGSIVKNGRYLKSSEMTPEELEEKRLANNARALIQNAGTDENPAVERIRTLFQNASRRKTAAQTAEELRAWMDEHQGRLPRLNALKDETLTEELRREIALGRAAINQLHSGKLKPTAQTEEIRNLWEGGQRRIQRRSPEEWLEAFKTYLTEHKRYPSKTNPEYAGIRNLMYRSSKNPDGTYKNPVVQQIYELNRLALAARRGDAEWEDVISGRGEDNALKRFWREAAPQDRAALQASAEEMEEIREDFADWLTDAVNNDWLVLSSQTYEALSSVRCGLDEWFDERADEADDILLWLADTWWGKDEETGLFSRVLFTGKNPAAPRLRDFRELQEFQGIPFVNGLQLPSAISAHTRLMDDGSARVMELRLLRGARPEDLHRAIENILPSGGGFTVRMGLHEFGVSLEDMRIKRGFHKGRLHLHAEAEVPGEPVVLSFILEIDARQLAAGKSFAELKQLYFKLFKPYLSEDASRLLR